MTAKQLYKKLPTTIIVTLLNSNGWLVGSSVSKIIEGEQPRDYDIIVSDSQLYMQTCLFLEQYCDSVQLNSCGGFKFINNDIEIDIWVEDLEHFLRNTASFSYAYSFKQHILLKGA